MLVIRLARFGKKKQPFYRIVVADSRNPVSGKYIEKIGHYNPLLNPPDLFVDEEKAKKWLKIGAKPSDTVWNLLVQASIVKKKLVTKHKKKKKQKKETEEAPKFKSAEKSKEQPRKPEKGEEQKNKEPSSEKEGRSASQDKLRKTEERKE